jgi:hypothetical protein
MNRDSRRSFTKSQRRDAYLKANGKCEMCGAELARGWECDHVEEWADGGVTQGYNSRALCRECHREKTYVQRLRRSS